MANNPEPAVQALQVEYLRRFPEEATRRLEILPVGEIAEILDTLPDDAALKFWERVTSDLGERLLITVSEKSATAALQHLEPNRSGDLVSGLREQDRERLLTILDPGDARDIRIVLAYPEGTAGSLMDPRVSLFRAEMTVADVLARIKALGRRDLRVVFVVDEQNRLQSAVEVQDLAIADPGVRLAEIARPATAVVNAVATREEVVRLLEEYRLTELPVIDIDGHLIGVVRHHALVGAVQAEATYNLQMMVGAGKEERALSKVSFAVRKRLPWLEINLLTAFLAAAVVGLFEGTIAKYTALAVLLPVVAGQSGNTGAQALAVVMRGLALREIQSSQWFRVVRKEMNVGLFNGIAVALTTGAGVLLWSGSIGLATVITVSMVISMVMAGMAGAAVPMVLSAIGQDPAQSSSIILTTLTDVAGFFSFLGIATLMIAFL